MMKHAFNNTHVKSKDASKTTKSFFDRNDEKRKPIRIKTKFDRENAKRKGLENNGVKI